MDVCSSSLWYLKWLLDDFQCAKLGLVVLKDELIDDAAVEDLRMLVADALIIDLKVTFLASSKDNDSVAWHSNHLKILTIRHA